jgi:hypothetical protein
MGNIGWQLNDKALTRIAENQSDFARKRKENRFKKRINNQAGDKTHHT